MLPQLLQLSARFVTLLAGFLVATVTFAQTPTPKPPQPMPVELAEADSTADAETLVVGDWYKVRVKRRGVSAQLQGELVKVNDQWIVLRVISEGRSEYAVPVASKIPYVGKRLFKNVGIGRRDDNLWIPRDAATVEERTSLAQRKGETDGVAQVAAEAASDAPVTVGEEPPAGGACELEIAGAKASEQAVGEVVAVTDDVVSLMVTRNVAVTEVVPLVGELPFVGRAFTRDRVERRKERRQIDRADILCLRVSNHRPVVEAQLTPAPTEQPAPVAPSPPMIK